MYSQGYRTRRGSQWWTGLHGGRELSSNQWRVVSQSDLDGKAIDCLHTTRGGDDLWGYVAPIYNPTCIVYSPSRWHCHIWELRDSGWQIKAGGAAPGSEGLK